MAGHDAQVTWNPGYARSPVAWPGAKSAPTGDRFGARALVVLLAACSSVSVFDVWLMLSCLS